MYQTDPLPAKVTACFLSFNMTLLWTSVMHTYLDLHSDWNVFWCRHHRRASPERHCWIYEGAEDAEEACCLGIHGVCSHCACGSPWSVPCKCPSAHGELELTDRLTSKRDQCYLQAPRELCAFRICLAKHANEQQIEC